MQPHSTQTFSTEYDYIFFLYLSLLRRVVLVISVLGLLTLALLWLLSFRKYGSRRIVYRGATR